MSKLRLTKTEISNAMQYAERKLREQFTPGAPVTGDGLKGPDAKQLKVLAQYVNRYDESMGPRFSAMEKYSSFGFTAAAIEHLGERASNFADHAQEVRQDDGKTVVMWGDQRRGDHVIDQREKQLLTERDEAYGALLDLAAKGRK